MGVAEAAGRRGTNKGTQEEGVFCHLLPVRVLDIPDARLRKEGGANESRSGSVVGERMYQGREERKKSKQS